jgi:hypothetical protein
MRWLVVRFNETVQNMGPVGQTDSETRIFSVLTRTRIGCNTPVRRKAQLSF